MKQTIDFYSGVLGMPLIKTIELPYGMGQHFFFDCGGGDCLAFFWFPDAPDGVPGISAPKSRPEQGELLSAVGSMNHVAFHVPAARFDDYRRRLREKGVEVSPVLNHDDSPSGVSRGARRRVRPVVLLPGPGWDPPGVRLLDAGLRRRGRLPPAEDGRRPYRREGEACRACVRSPAPRSPTSASFSSTTACSRPTATRPSTTAPRPARPATGGRFSPCPPTCSGMPSTASRCTATPTWTRCSANSGSAGPAGRAAASSSSRSTASRCGRWAYPRNGSSPSRTGRRPTAKIG